MLTHDNSSFQKLIGYLQDVIRTVSSGLLTGVGLPLIVLDHVIGVIFIFRNYLGVFSANDRALLQSFADQAAVAVNNARLYSQISQEKQRLDALLELGCRWNINLIPGTYDYTLVIRHLPIIWVYPRKC